MSRTRSFPSKPLSRLIIEKQLAEQVIEATVGWTGGSRFERACVKKT